MAQWMSFVLLVVATTIAVTESRAIPAEPIFLREKRTAVHPYPHRAMMFTSYYRPVRRTSHAGEATGVFAQGNAVSGEAFFGGMQTPHLSSGPEPIDEQKFSSAEAQAGPEESYDNEEPAQDGYQPDGHHRQEGQPQEEPGYPQNEQHPQEEEQNHHNQGILPPQEQPEPQPAPAFTTEAAPVNPAEEPVYPSTEAPGNRPKVHQGKKNKKPPVVVDDEEEEDEDEDELSVPFVPVKGNRRRQNYPNLNNFFPMMFSFHGTNTRSGSSGSSPPGAVTAIANSYSTAKGGVASSVATAYGGSPNGKKRRTPSSEE
ncbi:uncharacterized protein LOC143181647 isoform X2 [Calliopsis andreniformis]|uniref:uncharacterized protein LOC143181647 isoform X2 n=1 Tax=Calliopsis andreniformis TaxID=337506 RepID=UPI003FCCC94E